ncbi:flagellar basal body rod protein FlgG [Oceanobacillus sp. Castelsardo]|uniref:flagellar basal body rod protein FlgG n=1 Tax=Oceanobacillus sp. Castelsardo TaxID=1851204 RepID=UPI0008390BBE|nr:flagellar basal body rod protein FlgG [Oceanobacillus sp. Castelsardo]
MLRSMYAGISGMKNFQTKLDVIGNNIANVNTSGFKKGRVTFQDMLSQTNAGAQAPTAGRGGINPKQVGLGSQTGSIDNIHTQGFLQTTNNPLDIAIEGDGFFAVFNGETINYTRSGNFYLDQDGFIVDANGNFLLGTAGNELVNADDGAGPVSGYKMRIPTDAQSFSIGDDGSINVVGSNDNTVLNIGISSFSNPSGLEKVGGNLYLDTQNAGHNVAGGNVSFFTPGSAGIGSLVSGTLEMSNVDLAEEFTEMITAQRAFQANTRIITTSDEILQELVNLKR